MLFTVLDRETRFKAKPVIDVVLYRGGDVLTAWLFTLLADKLGFGLVGMAVVIGCFAICWVYIAILLGREYEEKTTENLLGID
jgi:AAA family ATP:ADP antiporter